MAGRETAGNRAAISTTGNSWPRTSRRISRRRGSAMARSARSGPSGLLQERLWFARLGECLEAPDDLAPGVVHRTDRFRRIAPEISHPEFDRRLAVFARLQRPGDRRVRPSRELPKAGPGNAPVRLELVDAHAQRHRRALELETRD